MNINVTPSLYWYCLANGWTVFLLMRTPKWDLESNYNFSVRACVCAFLIILCSNEALFLSLSLAVRSFLQIVNLAAVISNMSYIFLYLLDATTLHITCKRRDFSLFRISQDLLSDCSREAHRASLSCVYCEILITKIDVPIWFWILKLCSSFYKFSIYA